MRPPLATAGNEAMDSGQTTPSLFQRRLSMLLWTLGVIVVLLSVQLFRLSVLQGAQMLAEAQTALDRQSYLPATRGTIYDRRGQALARDEAFYAIAVPYPVISGAWAWERARQDARDDVGATRWFEMTGDERVEASTRWVPRWRAVADEMWERLAELGEVDTAELQRRRDEIVRRVERIAAEVRAANEPGAVRRVEEQVEAHVIFPRVSDEAAFAFRELGETFHGMLEVVDATVREYPWSRRQVSVDRSTLPLPLRSPGPVTIEVEGVADHILGSVRNTVYREDVERRPFRTGHAMVDLGGYRTDLPEAVGARGLERVFEDHLRGERGVVLEHRDTGERERQTAQHGHDLELALDVALQARVQAILSPALGLAVVQPWQAAPGRPSLLPPGRPLNAAAVVLEVASGDILAMVSMPTRAMGEAMPECRQAVAEPWYNRAIEVAYPPGSIVKPLVLASAVTDGVHGVGEPITCTGHYFPELQGAARCWIYREEHGFQTHGPLLAEEALGRSCNIYFYTLGDRLGLGRLVEWFREFGAGRPLDIGLRTLEEVEGTDGERRVTWIGESGGALPDDAIISALPARERRWEAISLAIGQGPIVWTPLHAANAYAMLARDGRLRDARLLRTDPRGTKAPRTLDLQLDPALLGVIQRGLKQTLEPGGSAYRLRHADGRDEPIINARGVEVWAKTGTAEAVPLPVDDDCDGEIDRSITGLDHAWFVGMVGPQGAARPEFVITVVIEHGGSGGRTAGPVANQIIHALQVEGYLPRAEDET